MSQLIRLDDRAKALENVFKTNMGAMAKVVPRTMGDPSRLLRIAYNNVAYDTALLECSSTPQGMASIFGGVMECLKLGLQIGGPMQEAWLIPFNVKGTKIATVVIGYQGYRNILDRGKSVIDLHPVAVHEGDEFDFELGSRPYVKHKPLLNNRGPLVAVYAVAHLPRGGIQIEVMGKEEIDQHRAKSRAKDSGPWVDFYEAMALKTVVRKIAKYLPKSSEILARALDLDDRADRGVDQALDIEALVFDTAIGGGVPMKQVGGSNLDKLKAQLTAGKPEPEKPHQPAAPLTEEEQREWDRQDAEELLTQDELRVKREKKEIEDKIAAMKAKEQEAVTIPTKGGPSTPMEIARGAIIKDMVQAEGERMERSGGFQPARDALFGDADPNKPIGKEAAQELLNKIKNAGPRK